MYATIHISTLNEEMQVQINTNWVLLRMATCYHRLDSRPTKIIILKQHIISTFYKKKAKYAIK